MMKRTVSAWIVGLSVLSGSCSLALAQGTATPAPPLPPKTINVAPPVIQKPMTTRTHRARGTRKATATTARSANSLACSAEANAKNLHGGERRKYRKACLAGKRGVMGKRA